LQRIEKHAFNGSGLRAIQIPSSVEIVGEHCFWECISLDEVTFESGCKLQRIEKQAFGESCVKAIRIPSNVEIIGENCFHNCQFLSEVTFESGCKLRRIEKEALKWSGVKKIEIPSSVEFIGNQCFSGCESLCEVTFEGVVKEIGRNLFGQSSLRYAKIPHGIELNCEFPDGCAIEFFDPVPASEPQEV
jgi:hypothetical protein